MVYVDGVADAHVAAAERGVDGERYIVSDTYTSLAELARVFLDMAGIEKKPWTAPAGVARALASVSAPIARALGTKPLLAPGELSFFLWEARADASKAGRELGFRPMDLREGLSKTLAFLRDRERP
jgi:nucleoside-diphosphate-sugar epimerase